MDEYGKKEVIERDSADTYLYSLYSHETILNNSNSKINNRAIL